MAVRLNLVFDEGGIMKEQDELNEIINRSYIVISDTHIGGNPDGSNIPNNDEICCFLNWIKHLPGKGERILMKKGESFGEKTILPPSKIILLGDILDLWDPENSDRSYVIKNAALPFSILQDIKCDKVYVAGNHDQDLFELSDVLEKDNDALYFGDTRMEVHRRHYPVNVNYGMRIGDLKYAFIHGHQFDKVQITETISRKTGLRFDPLDVVLDISNISIVKSVFVKGRATVVYFILLALILSWLYLKSSPGYFANTNSISSHFLDLLLAILVSYLFLTFLVKVIAKYQGSIWKNLGIKPRDENVEEVIKGGYYKESYDKMKVDVVVFGHTHIAGSYYHEPMKKLFVTLV